MSGKQCRKLCEHEGCTTRPTFDIKGGKGRFCMIHKTAEMKNVVNKQCEQEGCSSISPVFDIKGGKGRFCRKHKTAEMVDVKSKRCEHQECDSRPIFDIKGGKGRFCKAHKTTDMIDVKNKRCEHDDCDSRASFDMIGGKGRFCKAHKTIEMVDVEHKRCEHEGCDILGPIFDIKGGKGRFCVTHKMTEMVDVKSKRCEHEGCDSRPIFDIKGGKGRFCVTHKTTGMVDVKNKICEYEDCDSRATFNIKGGKGRFCKAHKTAEMVDVENKQCDYEGCNSQPSFNIKGGKGRFCGTHKTAEMVDVTRKYCDHEGCNTTASYGKPGNHISHCFQHRESGMIRRPNAKCKDCKESAIYGINRVPRHCESHKTSDDENLVERPCVSCSLPYILDKDNKCENCNPAAFATARLAKQNALMDSLDARDLKGDSTDKIVEGGVCGKERPDRIYDFGDKIVILECDEHQHRERACDCEQTRMINIGQSFGGIPVYFIRWNPDDYSPANSRKLPEDVKKRHKLVGDLIADIKENKITLPNALVSVLYMYYDDWSSLADEPWKIIHSYVSTTLSIE
jgi:uncharacterized linocin/CFP29 family protein